ncbi:unknown [Roseburia sp. CAG:380]|nr:unknown [Roseburia sp. CAG:380]
MNDRLPVAVKVRDKKTEITLVYVRMEGADGIN